MDWSDVLVIILLAAILAGAGYLIAGVYFDVGMF